MLVFKYSSFKILHWIYIKGALFGSERFLSNYFMVNNKHVCPLAPLFITGTMWWELMGILAGQSLVKRLKKKDFSLLL